MLPHASVVALGLFILLLGIIGYIRTKSPTAIGFNGIFGVVCIILGFMLGHGSNVLTVTEIWVALIAAAGIAMGTRRLMAPKRQIVPILMFASMAIFSIVVLIILLTRGPGSGQPPF